MTVVAVIFGVFAIGLIVLLIYKSTLTMHEDEQLFLDDASSHMHAEQTELLSKVNRLILPVRVFSTVTVPPRALATHRVDPSMARADGPSPTWMAGSAFPSPS